MKPKTDHAKRTHSKISPSILKPLQLCPGYESDGEDSAASLRGTFLHEIAETGKLPKKPWPEYTRPDDEEVAKTLLATCREADSQSEYEPLTEVTLSFKKLNLPLFEKGHADRIIVLKANEDDEPTDLEMIDWKFGNWAVDEPEKNLQFRAYALGCMLLYPTVRTVRVRIVQPALHIDEKATFSRDKDFEMIKTQIGAVVKRRVRYLETKDPEMLRTNPDICGFCDVQKTCSKWQQFLVKVANESNALGTTVIPIDAFTSPEDVNPDDVVRMFRWIKPLEEYLKKLKRFSLEVYDLGRIESNAVQLSERPGDPEITDISAVAEFLKDEYGVTDDEFQAACSIGITEIKGLVGLKSKHGEKSKEQDKAIKLLEKEGLISRGPTIRFLQLNRSKK